MANLIKAKTGIATQQTRAYDISMRQIAKLRKYYRTNPEVVYKAVDDLYHKHFSK